MTLKIEQKKVIVAEVANIAADAVATIAVQYQGLTVSQMTQLRANARQKGIVLKVVRNTLARRAFEGTKFADMRKDLVGPLLLVFSQTEPSSPARLIRDFAKDNEKLIVKAISLEGQMLKPTDLEAVAKLPSRDEAISMLMSVMQAPVTKFVRTLVEPHAKLVRTIAAIRDKKQAA